MLSPKSIYYNFILFLIFISIFSWTSASDGDRSPFYQNCVRNCLTANCTRDAVGFTTKMSKQQDFWSKLFRWNCKDECRYHCMWKTVAGFQKRGYQIPKFHGKWPFLRILGVQEPASAVSSFLNLAAHVYMSNKISKQFSASNMPIVKFWHVFTAVCINAWVWSTIFHTRDTPFTEFMDYACALSMVMALFIAAVVRVFHRRRTAVAALIFLTLLYYLEHVRYLYTGRVDYEYNMIVNLVFGVTGSLVWTLWSIFQLLSGARYAWRMLVFTTISGLVLSLELLDFPPKFHTWDAHALWHLSTAPLPLLFYRFVIDDLHYLQASSIKSDIKFS